MSFLIGYSVFAWVGPSSTPPRDNVSAPINVGLPAQIKEGPLGVHGFHDYSGGALFDGTVGIKESGSTFYTIFQGGNQGQNYTYILPSNYDSGCLTNAAGILSWQPCGGSSFWAANGNDIYNTNTGNIGIW